MTHASRPTSGRSMWILALVLAGVTLLALAARTAGISFQLPHTPNVDEQVLFFQLENERGIAPPSGKPSIVYAYPRLLARTAGVVLPRASDPAPVTAAEHRERASHDVVALRWMIAVIASLAVPLTFLLARRFTGDLAALVAAALVATSLLHALYSSQARPHGALTTCTLLAILGALRVRSRGDALSYVCAGLGCAAAVATLHSGAFTLLALVAAHVLRNREGSRRAGVWLAAAFAIVVAAFVWAYPVEPPVPPPPGQEERSTDPIRGHGVVFDDFNARGFAAIARAFANFDPWIALLAASAIVAWLVARAVDRAKPWTSSSGRDVLVVLAHALPHVLVFGMFDRTFQRFMLPILPYLCCAAAWLVERVAVRAASRSGTSRSAWIAVLSALVVAPQALLTARLIALKRAPGTQDVAADWIERNLDRQHARVASVPTFEVPLVRDAAGQRTDLMIEGFAFPLWTFHQAALSDVDTKTLAWRIRDTPIKTAAQRAEFERDPAEFVRALGATHAVVEMINHGTRRGLLQRIREAVREQGKLVARFAPRDGVEGDDAILYQFDGPNAPEAGFAWRLVRFDRLGPEIEIYELAAGDAR